MTGNVAGFQTAFQTDAFQFTGFQITGETAVGRGTYRRATASGVRPRTGRLRAREDTDLAAIRLHVGSLQPPLRVDFPTLPPAPYRAVMRARDAGDVLKSRGAVLVGVTTRAHESGDRLTTRACVDWSDDDDELLALIAA